VRRQELYRIVSGRRSAVDARALAGYLALVGIGLALATVAKQTMTAVNAALVTAFGLLPGATSLVILGVVQVVYLLLLVVAPLALALSGRYGVLGRGILGFVLAALVFGWVEQTFGLSRTTPYQSAYSAFVVGTTWPPTGALAAYTAAGVVAQPAIPRPWRRVVWGLLAVLVVHRVVTAGSAPLDVVLAVGVGGAVGTALLLVLGRSVHILTPHGVAAILERAGLAPQDVADVGPGEWPWRFRARTAAGDIQVKVVDEGDWQVDRLNRAYRRIRMRGVGGEDLTSSPGQSVAREALLGLLARTHGVRTPLVRAVARAPGGEAILACDRIDGTRLADLPVDALTDDVLASCWEQVARLRTGRIAHRNLHLRNLILTGKGDIWVTDFDLGESAADRAALAGDVSELLAATSARVGPERAVTPARRVLGDAALEDALTRLVPVALTQQTRLALKAVPGGLQPLTDELCRVTGVTEPQFARIERVSPRTLAAGAMLGVATYLLAPQLANLPGMLAAIRGVDPVWLPAVLLASVATYVGAGLGLAGGTPGRIPVSEAAEVALASSFVATFTPPGIGPIGINVRYLQKRGFGTPVAISASAAKEAGVVAMHLLLLGIFGVWAGRTGALTAELQRLPPVGVLAAITGGLLALIGVALATPPVRRLLRESVLPAIRESVEAMSSVITSPAKLAALLGGVLLLPLGDLACLYFSLEAFGGGLTLAAVAVVSLTAGTVATATPIPGGIGTVEAVLLASLTGLGIASPEALAAIFLYRLACFWLPIGPGALALRSLTRRELL